MENDTEVKQIKGLNWEKGRNTYRYRNPFTGKKEVLGRDRADAIDKAIRINELYEKESRKQAQSTIHNGVFADQLNIYTISEVIERYISEWVPSKGWKKQTLQNRLAALRLYDREFGHERIHQFDRLQIAAWLDARPGKPATRNKHLELLIDVWKYAVAHKIVDTNEAELVLKRSTTQELEINQKIRQRLQIDQFWQIHDHEDTENWLRLAMRLALITRQAAAEVCSMQYPVDGVFKIIRGKTASTSEKAFMKFPVTDELAQLVRESRADNIHSPFIIHRRFRRTARRTQAEKNGDVQHWTQLLPEYLGKEFSAARDRAGVAANLHTQARPTFHEIRSLGGRLLEQAGWSRDDIQQAYAHSDAKVTSLYLSDPQALKDHHFKTVRVGLDLAWSRSIGGGL